jgi:hypothetical protein
MALISALGFLYYHVNRKVSCWEPATFLENIYGLIYAAISQAPANFPLSLSLLYTPRPFQGTRTRRPQHVPNQSAPFGRPNHWRARDLILQQV